MKKAHIHIGTHKTGSTSLQRWLSEHRALLEGQGFGLYEGMHNKDNHIELYLAAMRPERDSFGKQSLRDVVFDAGYTAAVSERVRGFVQACGQENLIFTTEGLSLLRHPDELETLRGMFEGVCGAAGVVLYLRNKADYLESYRRQLLKVPGRKKSDTFWSALYVEDDTWLTDYDQLIAAYEGAFGAGSVKVIDYDGEMARRGNIIPSFAGALGLCLGREQEALSGAYRDNKTLSN